VEEGEEGGGEGEGEEKQEGRGNMIEIFFKKDFCYMSWEYLLFRVSCFPKEFLFIKK
jgi:hypothetical protein